MFQTFCPECDQRLKLKAKLLHKGQRLVCPRCETALVIINLTPLELEVASVVNNNAGGKKKHNWIEVACPECDEFLTFNATTVREGLVIICNSCDSEIEVVNTNPLELDYAIPSNARRNWVHRRR